MNSCVRMCLFERFYMQPIFSEEYMEVTNYFLLVEHAIACLWSFFGFNSGTWIMCYWLAGFAHPLLWGRLKCQEWHGFDCRWAPWEELLSPEAEFAVESLAPGEEEPVVSRESFEKLNPKWQEEHRKKLLEEAKRKEKERKPPTLEGSIWDLPLVFALIPPRDWPPPGWKVDAKELAFIREAHSLENVWVKSDDLKDAVEDESMEGEFPRWKMFLKQYDEWVTANKECLDREAQEVCCNWLLRL